MNRQQNTGGAAALVVTVLFVVSFVFILFVWPAYGVSGPEEVRDPDVILPVVAQVPILLLWLGINIPIALALGFVVLGLDRRLQGSQTGLVRLAFWLGLIAALCFLVVGLLRLIGYPYLADLYSLDPENAASAYRRYLVFDNAFDRAAIFASGLWLLLASWTAVKVGELPGALSYFGLLTGAAGITGAILPSSAPVALLLYIVWFLWFGMSTVRNRDRVSRPSASPVSSSHRPD